MKILLISGIESAIQGWGNMTTTKKIVNALHKIGHQCHILYAKSNEEIIEHASTNRYDLAWSSVYYFSANSKRICNFARIKSVTEVLENLGIPYVGSSSESNRIMIDKYRTIQKLRQNGIKTHKQYLIHSMNEFENTVFKDSFDLYFVKPNFESESNGITEESVVDSYTKIKERAYHLLTHGFSPVLVEEYLPGDEYTVSVIGNNSNAKIYPIQNYVRKGAYKSYPVIANNLNKKEDISFIIPDERRMELEEITIKAISILGCRDHVRLDIGTSKEGELRVIEVNGIPGLNPKKGRSYIIYSIYNRSSIKFQHIYDLLINDIIEAASERIFSDANSRQTNSI